LPRAKLWPLRGRPRCPTKYRAPLPRPALRYVLWLITGNTARDPPWVILHPANTPSVRSLPRPKLCRSSPGLRCTTKTRAPRSRVAARPRALWVLTGNTAGDPPWVILLPATHSVGPIVAYPGASTRAPKPGPRSTPINLPLGATPPPRLGRSAPTCRTLRMGPHSQYRRRRTLDHPAPGDTFGRFAVIAPRPKLYGLETRPECPGQSSARFALAGGSASLGRAPLEAVYRFGSSLVLPQTTHLGSWLLWPPTRLGAVMASDRSPQLLRPAPLAGTRRGSGSFAPLRSKRRCSLMPRPRPAGRPPALDILGHTAGDPPWVVTPSSVCRAEPIPDATTLGRNPVERAALSRYPKRPPAKCATPPQR